MADTSAIATTMRILEHSKSPTAQAVLMHALNVDDQNIRDAAARALVRSGGALAKTEVIRNIHRFSQQVIADLSQEENALSFPLRQCLQHGDQESSQRALETIESAQMYQEIPFLLKYLGLAGGESADHAEQVLLSMVDRLYDKRAALKASQSSAVPGQCEELVQLLGAELSQFEKVKRPRALIEAVLVLSSPEHPVARQLIRESSVDCQGVVWEILMNSRQTGVLMFLFDSLNMKYLHPRILEIISRRRDIEFQFCLARNMPMNPTVNQERNFCQLQALPWLFPSEELWRRFPAEWQGQLVRLIDVLAYRHEQKVAFYESALQFGAVEARVAAMRNRHYVKPQAFEQYVLQALDSPDASIEAWAVSELRNTELPDKYRYLVNRLDSTCELVQQRAREALGRFDVHSAIMFCDAARPSVGPRIAELLLKINPEACQDVSRELASPVRTKRLRAAKAAAVMGLQHQVVEALLEMLFDSDAIVRRAVAEILASVPTPTVISALTMLQDDSSPRVRETAQASLEQIERLQKSTQQPETDSATAEPAEPLTLAAPGESES